MFGQVDGELAIPGVEVRSRGFDGAREHRADIQSCAPQIHLVLRDARDVEQVVGDAHQMDHLTLHGDARALDHVLIAAREPHHLNGCPDRRERAA